MSEEQLDFTLVRFVAKVRKEGGQEYPEKTLYEMLSGIQMYLHAQFRRDFFYFYFYYFFNYKYFIYQTKVRYNTYLQYNCALR